MGAWIEKKMKDLVEYIAQGLVENPNEVAVEEVTSGDGTRVIELRLAEDDRGKVIGKKGRTAHAIRTLLHAISVDRPVSLDILD